MTDQLTSFEYANDAETSLTFKKPDLIKLERKINDHGKRMEQIGLDMRHYLNCVNELSEKYSDLDQTRITASESPTSDGKLRESVKKLSELVSKYASV